MYASRSAHTAVAPLPRVLSTSFSHPYFFKSVSPPHLPGLTHRCVTTNPCLLAPPPLPPAFASCCWVYRTEQASGQDCEEPALWRARKSWRTPWVGRRRGRSSVSRQCPVRRDTASRSVRARRPLPASSGPRARDTTALARRQNIADALGGEAEYENTTCGPPRLLELYNRSDLHYSLFCNACSRVACLSAPGGGRARGANQVDISSLPLGHFPSPAARKYAAHVPYASRARRAATRRARGVGGWRHGR